MFGFLNPKENTALFPQYLMLVIPMIDVATINPALIIKDQASYFNSFLSSTPLHPSQNSISFKKVIAPDRISEKNPIESAKAMAINSKTL